MSFIASGDARCRIIRCVKSRRAAWHVNRRIVFVVTFHRSPMPTGEIGKIDHSPLRRRSGTQVRLQEPCGRSRRLPGLIHQAIGFAHKVCIDRPK
jgi:hypothetical protein